MWRPANTRAVTGTNDTPLPNRRRFGDEAQPPVPGPAPGGGGGYGGSSYEQRDKPQPQFFNGRREKDDYASGGRDRDYDSRDRDRDRDHDRGRDRERHEAPQPAADEPRKRRSRWGDAPGGTNTSAPVVAVMGDVSQAELASYAVHVRLEEINTKLRTGQVVPPDGQRSPSPPPQYDGHGRRTNTREIRYRKRLEEERTRLVDRAMKADPNFRPPIDYTLQKRNTRPQDKVYIPVKEFPEINFFGLLVGPRGNTLKTMERESGAKISIRGKGSVKEGKGRPDAFAGDEEDELHCLVMADTDQKVARCVTLINKVIETAASTPEGQNDHKRSQLRELASLNGTLRDDENQLCQNCGEKGHRKFECPHQRVYSANIICRICGGAGHMARDCRGRGDPNLAQNAPKTAFDSEYANLMAELGEGGAPGAAGGQVAGLIAGPGQEAAAPWGGPQDGGGQQAPDGSRIPPWRIPENWTQQGGFRPQQQGGGYQQGGGGGGGGGYQQGGYAQQGGGDAYSAYYAQPSA